MSDTCVLSIDTSQPDMTRVRLEKNGISDEVKKRQPFHSSENVLPLVERLLFQTNTPVSEITDITVATGPGSYTGLRVGASVAQALGLLLGIPVNGQPADVPILLSYKDDPWNGS